MIDPTDVERTMQEQYEAECLEYHQWWIEQRQDEDRALSEQIDHAYMLDLAYEVTV
jgi:hypothetical protein